MGRVSSSGSSLSSMLDDWTLPGGQQSGTLSLLGPQSRIRFEDAHKSVVGKAT